MGASAAYAWTQRQYYVGAHDGKVTIFRGIDASLPGISLKEPYEESDIELAMLSRIDAEAVREGIDAEDYDDAKRVVGDIASQADPACAEPTATDCG